MNLATESLNVLYICKLIEETSKWTSYTVVTDDMLPTNIQDMVCNVLHIGSIQI